MNTTPLLHFGRPLSEARGALILLHGRGSSAEDIAGLTDAFDAAEFAFLAPSAEGGAWYPERFFVPTGQNEPWLSNALATVNATVEEVTRAGLPTASVGLVGFSQGACLALEHAARTGRRYGFVGALSGALIGPLDTPRPNTDLQGTPVLLGCAEHDAHIPLAYVEKSAATLEALHATVTKQIYRGGAHTVFPDEVEWINQQLARLAGRTIRGAR